MKYENLISYRSLYCSRQTAPSGQTAWKAINSLSILFTENAF
jgi:hypothetical protein